MNNPSDEDKLTLMLAGYSLETAAVPKLTRFTPVYLKRRGNLWHRVWFTSTNNTWISTFDRTEHFFSLPESTDYKDSLIDAINCYDRELAKFPVTASQIPNPT